MQNEYSNGFLSITYTFRIVCFFFFFVSFVNIACYTLLDPNAMETGEGLETRKKTPMSL